MPVAQSNDGKMGLWMTGALVIGSMISSGIFLLPGSLAPLGRNAVIAILAGAAFVGLIYLASSSAVRLLLRQTGLRLLRLPMPMHSCLGGVKRQRCSRRWALRLGVRLAQTP